MKYIIIGATGHVGNNLVRLLIEKGENVHVVVRKIDDSIKDLPITYTIGSFLNMELMKSVINEGDIVVHSAAYIDIKNKSYDEAYKVNCESLINLLDYSYKVKVKKFIFISSTDCINKIDDNSKILEPSRIDTTKFKDNYPLTKGLATNYVFDFRSEHKDFKLSIVYPSAVYGINDFKPSYIGKVIKDSIKGKMEFNIKGHYNFVYVKDVCNIIYNSSLEDENNDYLITGEDVSVKRMYETINENIKRSTHLLKLPLFIVKLSIPFVPYLSKFVIKTLNENTNYSSEKAITNFNYRITKFEDGMKETIEWFLNNNK